MTESSRRRRHTGASGWRAALLLACGFALSIAATGLGSARPSAQEVGGRRPFVHRKHVPRAWAENDAVPERLRDCRGCHVFDEEGPRDPQAVCMECHLAAEQSGNDFQTHFKPGWETLGGYRDPNALFRHYTHAALACRECHQPEEGTVVDPMPIRRGSAECTRCHGPPGERDENLEFELVPPQSEPKVPDSARRQLLAALNESPNMLPSSLHPFLHSEHLRDPGNAWSLDQLMQASPGADACSSCHAPVLGAQGDELQGDRFHFGSCGQCHRGTSGPLEFDSRVVTGESLAALTFSHADHLRAGPAEPNPAVASEASYARIGERGCHACHDYDADIRNFTVTDAASHEGCVSCHTSPEWRIASHGEWRELGCRACHTFAEAGGLASDRPMVEVRRRRATGFVIESQEHPHIAGRRTDTFEGNCKDCHRAEVSELPSRLGTRAFSHATHLPPNPTAEQCESCHGSRVVGAAASAAIGEEYLGRSLAQVGGGTSDLRGVTYDLNACADCHRGTTPSPVQMPYADIEPVPVPEFSHRDHTGVTGPDGAPVTCLSCHAGGDGAGGGIGTAPDALTCTKCHDHHPGPKSEISGRASAAEIARCSVCHVATIPAAGALLAVERERLSGLVGSEGQHHPDDRSCTECHISEWQPFSEADAAEGDHVFAERGRVASGRSYEPLQHAEGFLRTSEILCHSCHWGGKIPGYDFASEATREDIGNTLEQVDRAGKVRPFPGGGYRAQFGAR